MRIITKPNNTFIGECRSITVYTKYKDGNGANIDWIYNNNSAENRRNPQAVVTMQHLNSQGCAAKLDK